MIMKCLKSGKELVVSDCEDQSEDVDTMASVLLLIFLVRQMLITDRN